VLSCKNVPSPLRVSKPCRVGTEITSGTLDNVLQRSLTLCTCVGNPPNNLPAINQVSPYGPTFFNLGEKIEQFTKMMPVSLLFALDSDTLYLRLMVRF